VIKKIGDNSCVAGSLASPQSVSSSRSHETISRIDFEGALLSKPYTDRALAVAVRCILDDDPV